MAKKRKVSVGDTVCYLGEAAECVAANPLYFTIKLRSGRLLNLTRMPGVPAPPVSENLKGGDK